MFALKTLLPQPSTDQIFLDYVESLSCDKLLSLYYTFQKLTDLKQLPDDVFTKLRLQNFLIPTNFLPYLKLLLNNAIHDKILTNQLVSRKETEIVYHYLKENEAIYLDYCYNAEKLTGSQLPTYIKKFGMGYAQLREISVKLTKASYPLLFDFANHVLKRLENYWASDCEICFDKNFVLVVRQPLLVLSVCAPLVESWIQKFNCIKEIHFLASEKLFIDCSLQNSVWRGVNILIVSKHVQCIKNDDSETFTWNLSGLNGAETIQLRDSIKHYGLGGSKGADGSNGEDGGNVIIISKTFSDLNQLTVLCKGGNGANGRNGEAGENGKNGIDGTDANNCSLLHSNLEEGTVAETIARKIFNEVRNKIQAKHVSNIPDPKVKHCAALLKSWDSFYINGTTYDGHDFELVCNTFGETKRAQFLIRGTPGERGVQGGLGGAGGKGGIGGASGNVHLESCCGQTNNFQMSNWPNIKNGRGLPGMPGLCGKPGKTGEKGKDGTDMGYLLDSNTGLYKTTHGNFEMAATSQPMYMQSVYLDSTQKYLSIVPKQKRIHLHEKVETRKESSEEILCRVGLSDESEIDTPISSKWYKSSKLATIRYHSEICCDVKRVFLEKPYSEWWKNRFLKQ